MWHYLYICIFCCIFVGQMKRQLLILFLVLYSIAGIEFGFGCMMYGQDDPYVLRQEALRDFDQGKAADAQKKLLQAYDLFMEMKNWDMASMCLYERAIDYMNIGDMSNMSVQCDELQLLYEQYPSSMVAYNYHSVVSGYYSYVDSIDLAIAHGWRAIDALEQIENPSAYNIVPVWSYYNMAFFYDMYFQPPLVDSVRHYLVRARSSLKDSRTRTDTLEALISIVDLEAWQEYYEKDYAEAESMMAYVLELIDTVAQTSPNTVVTERGEAYRFMAMIHEEQGQWRKAYDYQQKLLDNNELRYDVDKRRVLQEVQTQYEVDKRELEMEKLKAENKSRGLSLLVCGLVLVALGLGFGLLLMRKRALDSALYEAALEADNMRQALQSLESKTDIDPLQALVDEIMVQLESGRKLSYASRTIQQLRSLDLSHVQVLLGHGKKITVMDKRYVLCFASGMSVDEIADFFNLEPATIYTVRYRLRKKFPSEYPFPY
jgi:tetratricopeptide (TPR) repeat protein